MENTNLLKEECLKRMELMCMAPPVIDDFRSGTLYRSEYAGILYWLNEQEQDMVRKWEKETGNMVYHVILNHFTFGTCYTFFFVSPKEECWEEDRLQLLEGQAFVYVENTDEPDNSEYGEIIFRPQYGGLVRIA